MKDLNKAVEFLKSDCHIKECIGDHNYMDFMVRRNLEPLLSLAEQYLKVGKIMPAIRINQHYDDFDNGFESGRNNAIVELQLILTKKLEGLEGFIQKCFFEECDDLSQAIKDWLLR